MGAARHHRRIDILERVGEIVGGAPPLQIRPRLPFGRRIDAALAVAAAMSSQCHAWAEVTRSNLRPAASQSSKAPISTSIPWRRAIFAIRGATSTPSTLAPRLTIGLAAIPVPQPTRARRGQTVPDRATRLSRRRGISAGTCHSVRLPGRTIENARPRGSESTPTRPTSSRCHQPSCRPLDRRDRQSTLAAPVTRP